MTLHNLIGEIESIDFATRLTVLSGFRILLLTLQHDETVKQLVTEMKQSPQNQQHVFERILEILPANDDLEYMHPYDPALTAYLYALNRVDLELAEVAIEQILQTPQLWWARVFAHHIQEVRTSDSVTVTKSNDWEPLPKVHSPDTKNARTARKIDAEQKVIPFSLRVPRIVSTTKQGVS